MRLFTASRVPVAGERCECEIDWDRRFDHMQQHTGQHVLSQAFVRAAKRNTVGFHMGADYVTIDLDAEGISPQQINEAEHLANRSSTRTAPLPSELFQNQKCLHSASKREPANWAIAGGLRGRFRCLSLWRHPCPEDRRDWKYRYPQGGARQSTGEGRVRLRTAFSIVWTARFGNSQSCCPTALGWLERGSGAGRETNSGEPAVAQDPSGKKQDAGGFARQRAVRPSPERQGRRIVKQLFEDEEMEFLKLLAHALLSQGNCVVLLGSGGLQAALLFAQSDDLPGDLRQILPACCQLIEGKGGGTRTLVQAGGKDTSQLQQALDLAERQMMTEGVRSVLSMLEASHWSSPAGI